MRRGAETMEQQIQGRDRQRQEEQAPRAAQVRTAERERLSAPGQLARAALEGASLLEMPPARLEELAAWLGNQGMAQLLERQALPVEETRLTLPEPAQTRPFPVPEGRQLLTASPPELAAQEGAGRAFDPAGRAQ